MTCTETGIQTTTLDFRNRATGRRARCGMSIFEPVPTGDGLRPGVIIVTQIPGDLGPSITACIESIAGELEQLLRAPLLEEFLLVEHYPGDNLAGPSFRRVEMGNDGRRWYGPKWREVTIDELDEMTRGNSHTLAEVLSLWDPAFAAGPPDSTPRPEAGLTPPAQAVDATHVATGVAVTGASPAPAGEPLFDLSERTAG